MNTYPNTNRVVVNSLFSVNVFMSNNLRALRKFLMCEVVDGCICGDFLKYFKRFDEVCAVQKIFGEKTFEVLNALKVEFCTKIGYMRVDSVDGRIVISMNYILNGDAVDIYLDLIHELFHVKQFLEGLELFDKNYTYVDRPTEIEAFQYTVQEARRIGLSEEHIRQYLKTDWINDADFARFVKAVGIRI